MYTDDKHFFVVTAIEDADSSTLRQAARRAPQEIVVEFLARRFFETENLAAGWIHALHHGADSTVFTGSIHRLEHEQHGVPVAGRENALQLLQGIGCPLAMFALVRMPVSQRDGAGLADPERAVKRHEVL